MHWTIEPVSKRIQCVLLLLGQGKESKESFCLQPQSSATHSSGGPAAYLAYVLYPPLYVAGPIITFNDFMEQVSCAKCISQTSIDSSIQYSSPTPPRSRNDSSYPTRSAFWFASSLWNSCCITCMSWLSKMLLRSMEHERGLEIHLLN